MPSKTALLAVTLFATACGAAADRTTAVPPGPFAAIAGIYTARTANGLSLPCEIKLTPPVGGGLQLYDFVTDAQLTLQDNGRWSEVGHHRSYRGSPGTNEQVLTVAGAGTFAKTVDGNPGDYTLTDTVNQVRKDLTFIADDRFNHLLGCLFVFQKQ
jgi:hypothetical protein